MNFRIRITAATLVTSVAALCGAIVCTTAQAQSRTTVSAGERVRLSVLEADSPAGWADKRLVLRGNLIDIHEDSMTVRWEAAPQQQRFRASVADLAVSRGLQSQWRAHPLSAVFCVVSVVTSTALLFNANKLNHDAARNGVHTRSMTPLVTTAIGLNVASLVVLATHRTERWERVNH